MTLNPKCFICLTKLIPIPSQNSRNQLHYIFHYLNTREREKGKFSNDKSPSQMQLCYECEKIVESFSLFYMQLEKVQMEVEARLKQICNKILRAEGTLEESEEIREKLVLNCANNFRKSYPQLKLSRLGEEEINAWKVKRSHCTEKQTERSEVGLEQAGSIKPKVEDAETFSTDQFIVPDMKEETDDFELPCHNGFDDLHSESEPIIIPTIETKTSVISSNKPWNAKPRKKYRKRCFDPRINCFISTSSPLSCTACGITCKDKTILKRHIARAHLNVNVPATITKHPQPPDQKRYNCDQCESSFVWSVSLRRHKKRHHVKGLNSSKSFNFKCDICGVKFLTQSSLRTHTTKTHRDCLDDPRERFKCNLCEKTFTQKISCDIHYKSKHMGVKFECNFCRKQFSFKNSLRNHQNFVCRSKSKKKG